MLPFWFFWLPIMAYWTDAILSGGPRYTRDMTVPPDGCDRRSRLRVPNGSLFPGLGPAS